MSEGNGINQGWEARQWWKALQPDPDKGNSGNRAALAKLRRVHSWVEAAAISETMTLFRALNKSRDSDLPRVAVLAAVLAHVRDEPAPDKNTGRRPSIARAIGKSDSESTAVLSELRLARLLGAKGDDDILIAFRRLVALMGKTANVADLAAHILEWDAGERGDRRRVNFAFNYWNAGYAAPNPAQAAE